VWVETVSQCKAVVLVIQVTRSACDGRSVRPYIDILHQGKPAWSVLSVSDNRDRRRRMDMRHSAGSDV